MLTFLTGTDVGTKRKYVSEKISALLDEGKKVILLVPEQSSFDRDREFLLTYGEQKSNCLKVSSFTHFSEDVLEESGRPIKPRSDDTARAVLMSLAVSECAEDVRIFRRFAGRQDCVSQLLSAYDEIKQAGLSHEELRKVSGSLSGNLQRKAVELSGIFAVFEGLLSARFSDPADNLKKAAEVVFEKDMFSDVIFFFDGFRGFTGAQLGFMSLLIAKSAESFVSVTAPDLVNSENNEAFVHSLRNAANIRRAAAASGVRMAEFRTDDAQSENTFSVLRSSLFGFESVVSDIPADNIKLVGAADVYEECELAALEIKRLLENGLRCRDIAVFERGNDYAGVLIPVLRKYGIPVFEDKRRAFYEYPLVRLLVAAVDVAANGFDTEKVLACVKTGLCGVSEDECSALENYVYMCGVNNSAWERDFTANPFGYGEAFNDEAKSRLGEINAVRSKLIAPLSDLRAQLLQNESRNDCRAVYLYLKEINAAESFLEYARYLYEGGNEAEAAECARVWDDCMSSLDSLNAALDGRSIAPRDFFSLLRLMLCSGTLGDIPAGIDEIIIGAADRMRFLSPRAVVILGANEGVFPRPASGTGIFTPREARQLVQSGFTLESLPENEYAEERLIAFDALTCAEDKLIVCFSALSRSGEKHEPSEIVSEIKRIFPDVKTVTGADYDITERLSTPQAAFDVYAEKAGVNSVFISSLREAVEKNGEYSGSAAALDRAISGAPAEFESREVATELFGSDLRSSASQTETYHKCPFMYFCRYGMGVNASASSELDPRVNGLLVHKVLEDMFGTFSAEEITKMSEEDIRRHVVGFVSAYVEEFMGGEKSLPAYIRRDVERSTETICLILWRFANEFGSCAFVTCRVELKIGGKEQDIPAYRLELPSGGSITVTGSIDRVDKMERNGQTYVRVIDYKTGGKEFKLSDVFDGLNMQMLLYLFALCENGKEKYGEMLPAGILYVPAKNGGDHLGREGGEEEIRKMKLANGRMNGLLLENEDVLRGMESEAQGVYINASIDAKGTMKGKFLTLGEFSSLHKLVDEMLISTAENIHAGKIPAFPIEPEDQKDICKHCDYAAVCLHESTGAVRERAKCDHAGARKKLTQEVENDG